MFAWSTARSDEGEYAILVLEGAINSAHVERLLDQRWLLIVLQRIRRVQAIF